MFEGGKESGEAAESGKTLEELWVWCRMAGLHEGHPVERVTPGHGGWIIFYY